MAVSFISIAPIIVKAPVPGTAPSSAAAPSSPTAPDFQSVLAGETSAPTPPSGPYVPGTFPAPFAEASASSKACAKGVVAGGNAAASASKAQIALDPATLPTAPGSVSGTRSTKPQAAKASTPSPQNPSNGASGLASPSAAVIAPVPVPPEAAVQADPKATPGTLASAGAPAIPPISNLTPGTNPSAPIAANGPLASALPASGVAALLAAAVSGSAATPTAAVAPESALPTGVVPVTLESVSVDAASVRPAASGDQRVPVPMTTDGVRPSKSTPGAPAGPPSTVSAAAAFPGAVSVGLRAQTGNGEKFAGSDSAPENTPVAALSPANKHTVDVTPESITDKVASIGTSVASPTPVMSSAANSQAAIFAPLPTAVATAGSPPAVALASPTQAVEYVLQIGELQAAQSQGAQSAVNLHFSVGGETLLVRVAMQEGQVHTQFTTDSGDLRAALAREWQSLGATGTGTVRFAEPVFTSGNRGDTKSGLDFASDSQQQAGRRRDDTESGSGASTASRTPGRAPQAPASPAANPLANPVAPGRLHSFA